MKKSKLSKIETKSKILSNIVTPILVFLFGSIINTSIENDKLKAQYMEIAVKILQDKSSKPPLKEYATNLIGEFSPVDFDERLKSKLINGELLLPKDIFNSITIKGVDSLNDKIDSSQEIIEWINTYKPINSELKKSITYSGSNLSSSPWAVIHFEMDNISVGHTSQWWLDKEIRLKAEGFYKKGRNSGWWNFYDENGDYENSKLYDHNKIGVESIIETSTKRPMKIGELKK